MFCFSSVSFQMGDLGGKNHHCFGKVVENNNLPSWMTSFVNLAKMTSETNMETHLESATVNPILFMRNSGTR